MSKESLMEQYTKADDRSRYKILYYALGWMQMNNCISIVTSIKLGTRDHFNLDLKTEDIINE